MRSLVVFLAILMATCLIITIRSISFRPFGKEGDDTNALLSMACEKPRDITAIKFAEKKEFLYLIQGEGEYPKDLDMLKSRRSDTLMLSWKVSAPSTNIFFPNSTWTSGRNKLLEIGLALERMKNNGGKENFTTTNNYNYFIFLDEDVRLGSAQQVRAFEDFLLEYEPAVASGEFGNRGYADPILPIWAFDAIFNAIHREALEMLPYSEKYDKDSWWLSQFEFFTRASALYKGHILEFSKLTTQNTLSRPYPRNNHGNFTKVTADIRETIPRFLRPCLDYFIVQNFVRLWGTVQKKKDCSYKYNIYNVTRELLNQTHPHYNNNIEHYCNETTLHFKQKKT